MPDRERRRTTAAQSYIRNLTTTAGNVGREKASEEKNCRSPDSKPRALRPLRTAIWLDATKVRFGRRPQLPDCGMQPRPLLTLVELKALPATELPYMSRG